MAEVVDNGAFYALHRPEIISDSTPFLHAIELGNSRSGDIDFVAARCTFISSESLILARRSSAVLDH